MCELPKGLRPSRKNDEAMSVCTFASSVTALSLMAGEDPIRASSDGSIAAHMIVALVVCPMSVYQFIISFLLLWQAIKLEGNMFLCSLWFTSHVSILAIYCVLFLAKAGTCWYKKKLAAGFTTFVAVLLYEGLYIMFLLVVNSYKQVLDKETYV